jgi:phosphoglycolate phosphatase
MIHRIGGKTGEFRHVFLDLDGTITESGPGIVNAVRYMFDKLGIKNVNEEQFRSFIGPPVTHHLRSAYGFTEEEAQRAYVIFREYYENGGMFESRLYDGITEAIEDIRRSGKRVYIATAKPEFTAMPILKHFGILPLFDKVFSVRREIGIYDKLQVLQHAAQDLGHISGAVMVGDRRYDVEGGQAVGFDTVGVLYGYGTREELESAGCDYLLDSVEDVSALLGGYDEGLVYRI